MTSEDMIMSKYGAIKEFFNTLSEHLNLENRSAKNFKEIINQQLEFILPFCSVSDDETPTNVLNQAMALLNKSTFIPYTRVINESLASKGDEEEIGKILVGIFYELRVRQPTTVQKVIQSMKGDCRLEMVHIIQFLETREDWPVSGNWAIILRMALPVELQEEWEDHENSILGDITNSEPDRRKQSIIMRTPLSRTQQSKRRRTTAHGSPLHDVLYSPIGQERMRVEELEKQIAFLKKKNLELHREIMGLVEETDKEHERLSRSKAPSVNHEMNRRMEEAWDLKLKLANAELEKTEIESMKKRLERELDAAHLNAFEFRQRCNEQAADLVSLAEERDKLASERDSLKKSIANLLGDYETRDKSIIALEELHKELNNRLRKKKLENADLEECYSNLRKELHEVELRSVAEREEYASVVRAKYEVEIAALKKAIETSASDNIEKSRVIKELETRLAEVISTRETIVKEAQARVSKFKEIAEKAQRDGENFFKDSLRAKEEIERLRMELVERCTAMAELANDLDEQERACFTHESDLATAQEQLLKLEAEKIARLEGAKALKNLPSSLSEFIPLPSLQLVAPTTKSVKSHPNYLNISTLSLDSITIIDGTLTIRDLCIEPPQIRGPRPSLATVFTARSGTPMKNEFVESTCSVRSKRSVSFAENGETKSRLTLTSLMPPLGRTDEETEDSSVVCKTPRMSLTKSAKKSFRRIFKHHN